VARPLVLTGLEEVSPPLLSREVKDYRAVN
jgi:hypothetical protein